MIKIVALTTFPPSTSPLSSFGYHAMLRFLEDEHVSQIFVLSDHTQDDSFTHPKIIFDFCWHYNSLFNPIRVVNSILKIRPDLVWINLQYTSFGNKAIPAFLGLMIPSIIKLLGYPTIIVLHNFLEAADIDKMGISVSKFKKYPMFIGDKIAMRSIMTADRIFTMVEDYYKLLNEKYPRASLELIKHDLYYAPKFNPPTGKKKQVFTLGYFGTYKKLEVLFEAFKIVNVRNNEAKLKIAGRSSPLKAKYLETLFRQFSEETSSVEFVGYISDENLGDLFQEANVIVLTNSTIAGSSGVFQLAATYGRPVVAPNISYFKNLKEEGWGIVLYTHNTVQNLADVLVDILEKPDMQIELGRRNFDKVKESDGNFIQAHRRAFRVYAKRTTNSE